MSETKEPDASFADMTPAERRVWAASHNLPASMMLVTREEMETMGNSMRQQVMLTQSMARTHKAMEKLLSEYWNTEPDILNAVGSAVFDGERFKKAVYVSLPILRKIQTKLDAAIKLAGNTVAPVVTADLLEVSIAIGERIKFLDKQSNLRRDRQK